MPAFQNDDGSIPDPEAFDDESNDAPPRLELRSAVSGALARGGFDDVLVLARERAADVFHERRLAILDHLREHDPASIRGLAADLGYDKGVVSRDCQRLAAIDVVEYEETGTSKAPRLKHDHVLVEPVV